MRYAIIENGAVSNVAIADAAFAQSMGWVECLPEVSIGWLYSSGEFTAPPEQPGPVPESVDNAQAREALIRSGISIATVDAAIQAIPDAVEREIAYTQWEYRATVRRDSELTVSLGTAIGLDNDAIDDLFRLAATL
jgi:hypothetical protein